MRYLISILVILNFMPYLKADTVSLRADKWCPFNCDPTSEKPGFLIEIAKAVLEKHGHKVDYQLLNWARSIQETREGKFNGIVGAAYNDAPDFIFPKTAMAFSEACFWVAPTSSWKFTGLSSLENIKFGIIQDYTYEPEFDKYIKDPKNKARIDTVSGDNPLQDNLNKLNAGRFVTFTEDQYVLEDYFFSKGLKKTVKLAGCLKGTDTFIAFGPKYPKAKEMAQLLSDGVKELRKSGELAKILAKYGLKDWLKH